MFQLAAELDRRIENDLLSLLSFEERKPLFRNLQCVHFGLGEVIYEHGQRMKYLYFPTSSVASVLCTMEDGSTAEVALIGNDGAVGVALFLGSYTATNRVVVQIAGDALRMDAEILRQEFWHSRCFQELLLRYTQALIIQISQTAVCNRLHSMEKRLCRWLLLSRDRVKSDEFLMTQEFIANMLGGRRESVTVAAGRLQDAGLIHYARGRIQICDRKGLESCVCECYHWVKCEIAQLFATQISGNSDRLVKKPPQKAP